ncbi:hypothetical protein ABLV11_07580, partial [Klebsiella sp. GW_Kp181]|uniref:hypothetical protein n=1 Tax=Klebsiella sp. GW_Kp181 TaxID=3153492 RepID=UPI0032B5F936
PLQGAFSKATFSEGGLLLVWLINAKYLLINLSNVKMVDRADTFASLLPVYNKINGFDKLPISFAAGEI